jgi:uncharacterized protein
MHIGCVSEFEFDPTKAASNRRKHGVAFSDAEQALCDPHAITVEDPDAIVERRYVTLGMDSLGRLLVVIHTPRGDRTRIISARKASRSEVDQYHAQGI